jgi:hypothetical protein
VFENRTFAGRAFTFRQCHKIRLASDRDFEQCAVEHICPMSRSKAIAVEPVTRVRVISLPILSALAHVAVFIAWLAFALHDSSLKAGAIILRPGEKLNLLNYPPPPVPAPPLKLTFDTDQAEYQSITPLTRNGLVVSGSELEKLPVGRVIFALERGWRGPIDAPGPGYRAQVRKFGSGKMPPDFP